MDNAYAARYWRDGILHTDLIYVDAFGHHVPLLDQHGKPVNFERKPMSLRRAVRAMNFIEGKVTPS